MQVSGVQPLMWEAPPHCSAPGFPVLHYLLELAQIHFPWVGDAHPSISSSVIPFSSCSQSFPASQPFPMTWFFASGSQSTGASTSASVLPVNIQGWFPLGLTDFISLQSKGLSRVFSNTTVQKHQFFGAQPPLWAVQIIFLFLWSWQSWGPPPCCKWSVGEFPQALEKTAREAGRQPASVRNPFSCSTVARLSKRAFASQTIHVSALPCKLSQWKSPSRVDSLW